MTDEYPSWESVMGLVCMAAGAKAVFEALKDPKVSREDCRRVAYHLMAACERQVSEKLQYLDPNVTFEGLLREAEWNEKP